MNDAHYEQLKQRMGIDPLRLDDELIGMPMLIEEVSAATATALQRRNKAEYDVKIYTAEASSALRNAEAKKPAEKQIESEVLLDPVLQQVISELEVAKFEYAMWQGLMEAARSKSHAIKTIAELIISGYLTPETITMKRRQELHAGRAKIAVKG